MRLKIIIMTILMLLCFKPNCSATQQIGDILIHNNDTILIYQFPLDQLYKESYSYNPSFFDVLSTACWRGYIAIWIIKDNKLFLKAIYDCDLIQQVPIDKIGKQINNEGLIFANWFSGKFKINLNKKEEMNGSWDIGRLFIRRMTIRILNGESM